MAEKTKRTQEEKNEIKKSIRTGLLAVVALAAVVCVIVFYFKTVASRNEPSVIKEDVKDLKSITLSEKSLAMPYVKRVSTKSFTPQTRQAELFSMSSMARSTLKLMKRAQWMSAFR